MNRYIWNYGTTKVDGEVTVHDNPAIDCLLRRIMLTVIQPKPRWKRRNSVVYQTRCGIRESRVSRLVKLEQIRVGTTIVLAEDTHRIGNGSLRYRSGLELAYFMHYGHIPINFGPESCPIIRKEVGMELRFYGSSYGLEIGIIAIVESVNDHAAKADGRGTDERTTLAKILQQMRVEYEGGSTLVVPKLYK